MFAIKNLGENSYHNRDFAIDRPAGARHALILIVHSPAEFYCDDGWQRIDGGTGFVFRPGQAQHYRAVGESYSDSWIWAEIPPGLLQEDFPFGQPIVLHHLQRYNSLLHLMCDEFYSSSPEREEIVHFMGLALIHMLGREVQYGAKPPLYYQLVQVRREIYRCPEQDWGVDTIAARVAVSPGYLQKEYKRFFGVTCNQEVIQSRIDNARALLRATHMPIEAVAEACGYHNTEHFIRQFKKIVGKSPGQYRKQPETGGAASV